ncbi:CDC25/cell division control protein/cell division control protein Cdc25 [Pelomyxa schiedti]|nr:CDC25/cell division control protein/cell division control protein Cdc25 [Pelomyxa schiedti]
MADPEPHREEDSKDSSSSQQQQQSHAPPQTTQAQPLSSPEQQPATPSPTMTPRGNQMKTPHVSSSARRGIEETSPEPEDRHHRHGRHRHHHHHLHDKKHDDSSIDDSTSPERSLESATAEQSPNAKDTSGTSPSEGGSDSSKNSHRRRHHSVCNVDSESSFGSGRSTSLSVSETSSPLLSVISCGASLAVPKSSHLSASASSYTSQTNLLSPPTPSYSMSSLPRPLKGSSLREATSDSAAVTLTVPPTPIIATMPRIKSFDSFSFSTLQDTPPSQQLVPEPTTNSDSQSLRTSAKLSTDTVTTQTTQLSSLESTHQNTTSSAPSISPPGTLTPHVHTPSPLSTSHSGGSAARSNTTSPPGSRSSDFSPNSLNFLSPPLPFSSTTSVSNGLRAPRSLQPRTAAPQPLPMPVAAPTQGLSSKSPGIRRSRVTIRPFPVCGTASSPPKIPTLDSIVPKGEVPVAVLTVPADMIGDGISEMHHTGMFVMCPSCRVTSNLNDTGLMFVVAHRRACSVDQYSPLTQGGESDGAQPDSPMQSGKITTTSTTTTISSPRQSREGSDPSDPNKNDPSKTGDGKMNFKRFFSVMDRKKSGKGSLSSNFDASTLISCNSPSPSVNMLTLPPQSSPSPSINSASFINTINTLNTLSSGTPLIPSSTPSLPPMVKPPKPEEPEEIMPDYSSDSRWFELGKPFTPENSKFLDVEDETGSKCKQLQGATLCKLFYHFTNESYNPKKDDFEAGAFLLTYRVFTTALDLMDLLRLRFFAPRPANMTWQDFKTQKLAFIRVRCLNLLKLWFMLCPDDFCNPEVEEKCKQLIAELAARMPSALSLLTLLKKATSGSSHVNANVGVAQHLPPPIIFEEMSATPNFDDMHPEEVARQMALIESEIFMKMKPYEFVYYVTEKRNPDKAPHLNRMVKLTNRHSNWVSTEILQSPDIKSRALLLKKFICIAEHCFAIHNYHAVMEIMSSLQSSAIHRLKSTWALLPEQSWETFEKLQKFGDATGNFQNYRTAIQEVLGSYHAIPCIPYIGRYITMCVFTNEGNHDTIDLPTGEKLINFAKWRLLALPLREIEKFQRTEYHFVAVPFIQDYMQQCNVVNEEEELYRMSLAVEEIRKTARGTAGKPPKELDKAQRTVIEKMSKEILREDKRKIQKNPTIETKRLRSSSSANVTEAMRDRSSSE